MKRIYIFTLFLILFSGLEISAQTHFTLSSGYKAEEVLPDKTGIFAFDFYDNLMYFNDVTGIRCYNTDTWTEVNHYPLPTDYTEAYYSFLTMSPDGTKIWVGFTVNGNSDDRIYCIDVESGDWTLKAKLGGNFDLDFRDDKVLVTGLNSADWSSPNSVWLLDETGANNHKKIIEISGNSSGITLDDDKNIYNGTYSDNNLYRWNSADVSNVINNMSATALTINDATQLSSMPAGAYNCLFDDKGDLFFDCNIYGTAGYLCVWNGTEGNGENFDQIATTSAFLTALRCKGSVSNNIPTDGIFVSAFGKPLVKIHKDIAPQVVNPIANISLAVTHEASTTIDITNVFTDPDDDDDNITKTVFANSNPSFAQASIAGNTLTVQHDAEGEGETEIIIEALSNGLTTRDTFTVKVETIDYTQGYFVVNEDWFGHDVGTVNFIRNNGEVIYRAYRRENQGKKLGVTTEFATIYGDKAYFVSKQEPRLVVADAHNLTEIKTINEIGGADGRAFLGVNANTGYISTSDGIYTFSITDNTVGNKITGTDGETGNMLLANGYVFAVQQNRVLILQNDAVVSTIEGDEYAGMTRTVDGTVWVGAKTKLIKINPYNLTNESVEIPTTAPIQAPWYAWNANSLCASPTENVLFWVEDAGWNAARNIYKYEVGNASSLDNPFITVSDYWTIYGAGLRINPVTNEMSVLAKKNGWGENSEENQIQVFNTEDASLVSAIDLQKYYWFPAMPMFVDVHDPVANFEDITVSSSVATKNISLVDFITDADNLDRGIVTTLNSVSNGTLLSANISNDTLFIDFADNQYGTSSIELKINSNGKEITTSFDITKLDDAPPVVANPIADVDVKVNAADYTISLANVFTDEDDDDNAIVKTVSNNTNADLVTTNISGNDLTLSFAANAHGVAEITVEAVSNGKSVTDVFSVTVNEDQAPTVANPIADVEVVENAADYTISLANVFTDEDNDDNAIVKSVSNNTNTDLVTTSISGNDLTLSFAANAHGVAEITIEAVSNGKSVTDVFTVTVTEDQAPTVANPIADVEVDENAADYTISLANVFTDEDNDDNAIIKSVINNTNTDLVTARISGNDLTLSFVANTYGVAEITVEALSNGKSVTDVFTVTVIEDIAVEIVNNNDIMIYPNPSNGVFKIKTNSDKASALRVYDIKGGLVYSSANYISDTEVNISKLPAGQYIVLVSSENEIFRQVIILK